MHEIAAVVTQILKTLDDLAISYAVGGSFASGIWGNPRQTRDVDISVYMRRDHIQSLATALATDFMLSESEMTEAVESSEEYRTFQLLHFETTFKADVFVRGDDDYDLLVLERAPSVELFPGFYAKCFSAEDIVIQKLRWFELGNRVSDRQWNDIVQVLEIQVGRLDYDYLRQWSARFGVLELLENALDQALD